jgi:hypothetical protein
MWFDTLKNNGCVVPLVAKRPQCTVDATGSALLLSNTTLQARCMELGKGLKVLQKNCLGSGGEDASGMDPTMCWVEETVGRMQEMGAGTAAAIAIAKHHKGQHSA